ncbi:MAG: glycerate kinase [candidate division KSB1 bacterium]|nr:glycerate kinase [candidate division KSB1 bacterium]
MKIILAPDSFKESLSAPQVCAAMTEGVLRAAPGAETVSLPLADGGEGTVEAMLTALGGRRMVSTVTGPLGEPVRAAWGILEDGRTAVIETASAAGLSLVLPQKRNPLFTTTFGLGELIRQALDEDVETLLVGLGGSATNDLGLGMAQALGALFYDDQDHLIDPPLCGKELARIRRIDLSHIDFRIHSLKVIAACDVDNPLLGPRGAARVFAPQKGASPAEVEQLEAAAASAANVLEAATKPIRDLPGAGAAGGLGAAFYALFNAELRPGIDLILDAYRFDEHLQGTDLVLTGEGKVDEQTAMGKVISGLLRRTAAQGTPVVALAGYAGDALPLFAKGLSALFSICNRPMTLQEAIIEAPALISRAAEQVVRTFAAGKVPNKAG